MQDVGSQGPLRGSRADGVNCEGGEPRRRVSPQGPLRGSVSCGSGWSVPRVSIQLTLAQQSTQHTHHLSFTDGPRKGEQARITMTAPHALTNTYKGGGAS